MFNTGIFYRLFSFQPNRKKIQENEKISFRSPQGFSAWVIPLLWAFLVYKTVVHPERHNFIKDAVKEQEHEALKQLFLGPWPHLGVCLSSQPCIRSLSIAEVKTVLNKNEHVQVVAAYTVLDIWWSWNGKLWFLRDDQHVEK